MSQDAHDEKTRKKRRLKTRRFAEEEEEDEKSLAVHPSGIQMLQKLRAKKSKEDAMHRAGQRAVGDSVAIAPQEAQKFSWFQASFSKESFDASAQKQKDKDMDAFIEKGLEERLGRKAPQQEDAAKKHRTIDELAMEIAPKRKIVHDEPVATVVSVDEVPVRLEHKLRNIEEMERAKAALLSRPIAQDKKHDITLKGLPTSFGKPKRTKR
ncbi:hypothetical protein M9434_003693 [Picochlorum sp. BPE23]|nr:hypothetical protein M9434_003693 [Picochlorum sp. BPE23]